MFGEGPHEGVRFGVVCAALLLSSCASAAVGSSTTVEEYRLTAPAGMSPTEADSAARTLLARLGAAGVPEAEVTVDGTGLVADLPVGAGRSVIEPLLARGRLAFRPVVDDSAGQPEVFGGAGGSGPALTPPEQVTDSAQAVLPQRAGGQVVDRYVVGPTLLDSSVIATVAPEQDANGNLWHLLVTFTAAGGADFDRLVAQPYYQHLIAIVIDNAVITAPVIQAHHFSGSAQITGANEFTQTEAKNLALVLGSGALPAPLTIESAGPATHRGPLPTTPPARSTTVPPGEETLSPTPPTSTAPPAPTSGLPPGRTVNGPTPCPAVDATSPRTTAFSSAPPMCITAGKPYTATVRTNLGDITVTLDTTRTPETANNFVVLARYHYYDSTSLFRVDPSIDIIQGGSPTTQSPADPGPGYTIPDEGGRFTYQAGDLVMARSSAPHSGAAQFFFVAGPNGRNLDSQGTYVTFGHVSAGLAVLQKIEASYQPCPSNDTSCIGGAPNPPVTISTITINT